ncbi:hypothetical protein [Streptomyces sp. BRA346]|uniref:hypothetical protein n=1 Tax=Streptomyces sp. BRA346 TaxID=2878199 RepID=UPI004063B4CA
MTTVDTILRAYAADVAVIADQPPATTWDGFLNQVATARDILAAGSGRLGEASDAFDAAHALLAAAVNSSPHERSALLDKARTHLDDAIAWA